MNKTPVTFEWHQENCKDPVLQHDPKDNHYICSTCGEYVQPSTNQKQFQS